MSLLKETSIVQRFSDGEVIISEGIISNNAYIVLTGEVRITKKIDKKILVLGTLKAGDIFGEMGLITKSARSATVSALGDVEVGFIDKEKFDEVLNALPEDLRAVVIGLVEKLRRTTDVLTKIGSKLENPRNSIKPV